VGQQPFLEPDDEDRLELETFRGVKGHQNRRGIADVPFRRCDQGSPIQKGGDRPVVVIAPSSRRHELAEVVDPVTRFRRLRFAQPGKVSGLLEDGLQESLRAGAWREAPQLLDQRDEASEGRSRATVGGTLRDDVPERTASLRRDGFEADDGPRPDAARRHIDHPPEGDGIPRIERHAEEREGVPHLLPLVEADRADHDVVSPLAGEGLFKDAALSVRPEEDRRAPLDRQRGESPDHPGRLGMLVGRGVNEDRCAAGACRAQDLSPSLPIVRDERRRGVQHRLTRAVVVLEPNDAGARVVALELEDVSDGRAAPRVDRLVLVPYDRQIAGRANQEPENRVLNRIGVLVLIDEDEAEQSAPAVSDSRVALEEGGDPDQEVVEVQRVSGQQHRLIPLGGPRLCRAERERIRLPASRRG
jgi:hypothetical protein